MLVEPERSRDHTERMLSVFGAEIDHVEIDGALHPRVRPSKLKGVDIYVPGDPSSAAFPVAAALIVGKSEVRIDDVLVNPLRLGFFETLLEMGAKHHLRGAPRSDWRTDRQSRREGIASCTAQRRRRSARRR